MIAAIHGGPGAPGEMAPVARELASRWGVLEPLQTANSVEGQLQELKAVLRGNGQLPIALIGFSWGAMLGFMFAARYSHLVRKLILVASGVYEDRFAVGITATRLSRLSHADRQRAERLMQTLDNAKIEDKNQPLAELGYLFTKADIYDPLALETEVLEVQYSINQSVWEVAKKLRASGELLAMGEHVRCPVVAIHGSYDSHPAEGVRESLASVLTDFRFVLLENCGHYPWLERQARYKFYEILFDELTLPSTQPLQS